MHVLIVAYDIDTHLYTCIIIVHTRFLQITARNFILFYVHVGMDVTPEIGNAILKYSAFPISGDRLFPITRKSEPWLALMLWRVMAVFREWWRNFTFGIVVLCAISCYRVLRYYRLDISGYHTTGYHTQYTKFEDKTSVRLGFQERHPYLALAGELWVTFVNY